MTLRVNHIENTSGGIPRVKNHVIYVDTIADLQALPTSELVDGQTAKVISYHQPLFPSVNFYGGGEFYWDSASTETDDGGTVFGVNASGRWLRIVNNKTLDTAMFGVDLSGTDAAGSQVQACQSACEANGFSMVFTNGTYNMGATELVFDKAMSVRGESRDGVRLNFNLTNSGQSAIHVSKNASVNGFQLSSLTLDGTNSGTGLKTGNTITESCVDSTFSDIRVQQFATGLEQSYTWASSLNGCRFQSCARPADLGSQVNLVTYIACSFVTYTSSLKISNCEGLHFSSCNVSNSSGAAVGMTLFQSTVVFTNPYFENNAATLAQVGASSELYSSALTVIGGTATPATIFCSNSSARVSVTNIRSQSATEKNPLKIAGESDAPFPHFFVGDWTPFGQEENTNTPTLIYEVPGNMNVILPGAYGGSVRYFRPYRNYTEIEQQAAGNGLTIYSDLVIGTQYTIAVCMRKEVGLTITSRIDGFGNRPLNIPDSTGEWEWRTMPHVANGNVLRFLFTGKIQIKGIRIYEGVLTKRLEVPGYHQWFLNAAPAVGAWERGDVVYNNGPDAGGSVGWVCTASGTPGTWKAFGAIEV